MRSPIAPKKKPPNGLARKPTPNVASEATSAMLAPSAGKNNLPKMSAEASP